MESKRFQKLTKPLEYSFTRFLFYDGAFLPQKKACLPSYPECSINARISAGVPLSSVNDVVGASEIFELSQFKDE
ncbi:hypothetical protein [Capybara microvirus Cap1_SP_118]|nr:hypothetical protein [Capybara microvirus Cap1_SP_118]